MDTEWKLNTFYYLKKSSNSTEPYFINEYAFSININYYIDC